MPNYNGTSGPDTYTDNDAGSTIHGNGGNDTLYGQGGTDVIYGDDGNDFISGGNDADNLFGGNGNDTINGDDGYDWINGGAGNDTMSGGTGNDTFQWGVTGTGGITNGYDSVDGGAGTDTILISPVSGYVWTAVQLTHLSGVEIIQNNEAAGQPGYINVDGNVDFSDVQTYIRIDSITGQSGNDTITGSSYFDGTSYVAENILGGAGDDRLDGGAGVNSLTGNAGADHFQISQDHDHSTIFDFTNATDYIDFRSSVASSMSDLTFTDDGVGNTIITSATSPTHDLSITVVGIDSVTLMANANHEINFIA